MNQDSSTDLFASLAGMMIIIVAILMTAVNVKEELVSIENKSASSHQLNTSSPGKQKLGLLEVAYQSGKALFYWKPTAHSKKQEFHSYNDVRKAVELSRPDGIRLRLDDRVKSGVFKKLLAYASDRNIAIYQSDQVSK